MRKPTLNRRDLLSSLVFAAVSAEAQESAPPTPSLYIPNAHRVDDRKLLHDFMEEFAFVDLITAPPLHIAGIDFSSSAGRYVFSLAVVVALTLCAQRLVRAQTGLNWIAVRDRELAATVIGVPVFRPAWTAPSKMARACISAISG